MSKESQSIQDAIDGLSSAIIFSAKHLGKEDCSDPQGCLELIYGGIKDGSESIANGLDAIATGLHAIADAINNHSSED